MIELGVEKPFREYSGCNAAIDKGSPRNLGDKTLETSIATSKTGV
jgi:hypothetical protein